MHPEAFDAVGRAVHALGLNAPCTILDVGGRHVNGSVRGLFHPDCEWTVIDREPGEGVDIVEDVCEWQPDLGEWWDVAIATEMFEHEPRWPLVLHNMCSAIGDGGALIVTAACDPREPHSAIDGWALRDGEAYANVAPDHLLWRAETELGGRVHIETHPRGDVYLWGVKR